MSRISLLTVIGIVIIFAFNVSCGVNEPLPAEPETLTITYDEMAVVIDGNVEWCGLTIGTTIKSVARIVPDGLSSAHVVYLVEVVNAPIADKFPEELTLCHVGQKLAITKLDMNRLRAMSYAVKKFSKNK